MTNDSPDLESAYDLKTADDHRRLYGDWAGTYDRDFVAASGYFLADKVAEAVVAAGGRGPVLDVGAGTGRVAEVLQALGVGPVDGLDISPEMLAVASARGLYRETIVADFTESLPPGVGGYASVVAAGVFTHGHLGPGALPAMLDVAAPGATVAIAVNAAHWDAMGFGPAFAALSARLEILSAPLVRIYAEGAGGPHGDDMAHIVTARTPGG